MLDLIIVGLIIFVVIDGIRGWKIAKRLPTEKCYMFFACYGRRMLRYRVKIVTRVEDKVILESPSSVASKFYMSEKTLRLLNAEIYPDKNFQLDEQNDTPECTVLGQRSKGLFGITLSIASILVYWINVYIIFSTFIPSSGVILLTSGLFTLAVIILIISAVLKLTGISEVFTRVSEGSVKLVYREASIVKLIIAFKGREILADGEIYPRLEDEPMPFKLSRADRLLSRFGVGGIRFIGLPIIDQVGLIPYTTLTTRTTDTGFKIQRVFDVLDHIKVDMQTAILPIPAAETMEFAQCDLTLRNFYYVLNVYKAVHVAGDWEDIINALIEPYVRDQVAETSIFAIFAQEREALKGDKYKDMKIKTREELHNEIRNTVENNKEHLKDIQHTYGVRIKQIEPMRIDPTKTDVIEALERAFEASTESDALRKVLAAYKEFGQKDAITLKLLDTLKDVSSKDGNIILPFLFDVFGGKPSQNLEEAIAKVEKLLSKTGE